MPEKIKRETSDTAHEIDKVVRARAVIAKLLSASGTMGGVPAPPGALEPQYSFSYYHPVRHAVPAPGLPQASPTPTWQMPPTPPSPGVAYGAPAWAPSAPPWAAQPMPWPASFPMTAAPPMPGPPPPFAGGPFGWYGHYQGG